MRNSNHHHHHRTTTTGRGRSIDNDKEGDLWCVCILSPPGMFSFFILFLFFVLLINVCYSTCKECQPLPTTSTCQTTAGAKKTRDRTMMGLRCDMSWALVCFLFIYLFSFYPFSIVFTCQHLLDVSDCHENKNNKERTTTATLSQHHTWHN